VRLLAIDTSAELCSVGVAQSLRRNQAAEAAYFGGGGVGIEPVIRSAAVGRAHAERLIPMIADAMAAAGLAFTDLTRIAVTVGPGSFTGVRIGVAAARGLALATGAEAVGVGTLAVHAEAARAIAGAVPVVVAITAGRGEIYAQRFAGDGAAETEPKLAAPPALAALITGNVVLAGSGADALAASAGAANHVAHHHASPDVAALLRLAEANRDWPSPPRPLYLRPPDAKPQVQPQVPRR
jgi:tRNA threonylcarbamoyl adenosine modification protein YeaZ